MKDERWAQSRGVVKRLLAWGNGELDELPRSDFNAIAASYDLSNLMFEMSDQRFERIVRSNS